MWKEYLKEIEFRIENWIFFLESNFIILKSENVK